MALVLLEALQADAALLCQDVPLERLQKSDGIEHLFAQLAPLEQQKGLSFTAAMRAYEQIRRMPNELAKSYHARFLAVEAQLQRLGLTVYVDEARALKWLSGLDLPAQEQRNVLTAAGAYDTERLRAA
eukprot:586473-Amphidinium_carterae.1